MKHWKPSIEVLAVIYSGTFQPHTQSVLEGWSRTEIIFALEVWGFTVLHVCCLWNVTLVNNSWCFWLSTEAHALRQCGTPGYVWVFVHFYNFYCYSIEILTAWLVVKYDWFSGVISYITVLWHMFSLLVHVAVSMWVHCVEKVWCTR